MELPPVAEDGDLIMEPKIMLDAHWIKKRDQICLRKRDQMEKTSNR